MATVLSKRRSTGGDLSRYRSLRSDSYDDPFSPCRDCITARKIRLHPAVPRFRRSRGSSAGEERLRVLLEQERICAGVGAVLLPSGWLRMFGDALACHGFNVL